MQMIYFSRVYQCWHQQQIDAEMLQFGPTTGIVMLIPSEYPIAFTPLEKKIKSGGNYFDKHTMYTVCLSGLTDQSTLYIPITPFIITIHYEQRHYQKCSLTFWMVKVNL